MRRWACTMVIVNGGYLDCQYTFLSARNDGFLARRVRLERGSINLVGKYCKIIVNPKKPYIEVSDASYVVV